MKKLLFVALTTLVSSQSFSADLMSSVFDFAAPVVANNTFLSNISAGTIVFDAHTLGFYGLANDAQTWYFLGGSSLINRAEIRVDGFTNLGSGANAAVVHFANPPTTNNGNGFLSIIQSATNGDSIVCIKSGTYSAQLSFRTNTVNDELDVNINSSIYLSASSPNMLLATAISGASTTATASSTFYCNANDVLTVVTPQLNTVNGGFTWRVTRIGN
jgi:hypothetical protein